MKENKRYLLVKGNPENIKKAILDFIGVLGMSRTGFSFIKKERDFAVICINRESVNEVRAGLCVWPEKMEVAMVSGTLKSLKKKAN
ncbi:MAG: Rpp14/Pop5 family protein [Candidatus Pacearchaeota archaeon]|nr:Rpp14/Pop5 family protein [Candidatus Pacearchaeota archaeon]